MGEVERWVGKPRVVEMMLYDGSIEAEQAIQAWVGPLESAGELNGEPMFQVWSSSAVIWNTEEHCWVNCPIGHRIAKGRLGEFYPISPAALEAGYLPQGESNGEDPRPA